MMRSELFGVVSLVGIVVGVAVSVVACSDDAVPPPAQPAAGGAAVGGTAGLIAPPVAGQTAPTGTAGTGTLPSGVGTAGSSVPPTGVAGAGVAGAGAAGMVAAGTGAAGMGAAGAPAFTPGSPTFSAIFQEIIVGTGCNGGPTCHASAAAGQLKMSMKNDSWMALVGVKAMGVNLVMSTSPNCKDSTLMRVVAGDPNASLLYKKVMSATPECGGKMPPSGATLAPEKLEQIRLWIMNGAKND